MKDLTPFVRLITVFLILVAGANAQEGDTKNPSSPKAVQLQREKEAAASKYVPVHVYDPKRNAELDIRNATVEAARTGKRILLEVGGDWCVWCHIMDSFFEKNPDLLRVREKNFVMVKINFSEENKNEQVLSRYPPINGYPHLFVLAQDGKLLHSQDTAKLEVGKSYDLAKFMAFLKEWSPRQKEGSGLPVAH